jgi:iron complex outermembrane recepter protein
VMFSGGATINCGDPAYAGLQACFQFQGACSPSAIARVRVNNVNGSGVKTSGVDFMAEYKFDTGIGDLTFGVNGTYTIEYAQEAFIVEGIQVADAFDGVGYLNYQTTSTPLPQIKGQAFGEWNSGPHNLRVTVRYFDDYKDQRPIFTTTKAGEKIDSWAVIDVAYRAFLPWDMTGVVSVTNLTDEDPPFARLDLNYDPFTHNGIGRTVKFSLTKRF